MAFRRTVVALSAVCFLGLGIQTTASAGVIGTQEYLGGSERAGQLAQIQSLLSRHDVRDELVRLGVDPAAAAERVASLSDQEIAQLAGRIDEIPAGGDSLLAVIGIVFIVFLILEITGVTDIFKKV